MENGQWRLIRIICGTDPTFTFHTQLRLAAVSYTYMDIITELRAVTETRLFLAIAGLMCSSANLKCFDICVKSLNYPSGGRAKDE